MSAAARGWAKRFFFPSANRHLLSRKLGGTIVAPSPLFPGTHVTIRLPRYQWPGERRGERWSFGRSPDLGAPGIGVDLLACRRASDAAKTLPQQRWRQRDSAVNSMKKMPVLVAAWPAGRLSTARSGGGSGARASAWARLRGSSARLSGQQPPCSAAGRGEGVTILPRSPKFLLPRASCSLSRLALVCCLTSWPWLDRKPPTWRVQHASAREGVPCCFPPGDFRRPLRKG